MARGVCRAEQSLTWHVGLLTARLPQRAPALPQPPMGQCVEPGAVVRSALLGKCGVVEDAGKEDDGTVEV